RIDEPDDMRSLGWIRFGAQLRNEQIQRMQRLAQIMACCSEKARLGEVGELELMRALFDLALERGIGALELGGHMIELIAERLKLVAGVDFDAMIECAGSDLRRTGLQGPNRRHHPA